MYFDVCHNASRSENQMITISREFSRVYPEDSISKLQIWVQTLNDDSCHCTIIIVIWPHTKLYTADDTLYLHAKMKTY
jgi:hypothetical protein